MDMLSRWQMIQIRTRKQLTLVVIFLSMVSCAIADVPDREVRDHDTTGSHSYNSDSRLVPNAADVVESTLKKINVFYKKHSNIKVEVDSSDGTRHIRHSSSSSSSSSSSTRRSNNYKKTKYAKYYHNHYYSSSSYSHSHRHSHSSRSTYTSNTRSRDNTSYSHSHSHSHSSKSSSNSSDSSNSSSNSSNSSSNSSNSSSNSSPSIDSSPHSHPTNSVDGPTKLPTKSPTKPSIQSPTKLPTNPPTKFPTKSPTKRPTKFPTKAPLDVPSPTPTNLPTGLPSVFPTRVPSRSPSGSPTRTASVIPSFAPTASSIPSLSPTRSPKPSSTRSDPPTNIPSASPSSPPTQSLEPSAAPVRSPSDTPTDTPSSSPSTAPTTPLPTKEPTTKNPTKNPTKSPVAAGGGDACPSNRIWINELHYQNIGIDLSEFVEVAHSQGMSLAGYRLIFYDGATGAQYRSVDIAGSLSTSNSINGLTFVGMTLFDRNNPIQDGPDGIAVVDGSNVVQDFISYGGSFTATDGPAQGSASVDIGATEPANNLPSDSLQLGGNGYRREDFVWGTAPDLASPGRVNAGQTVILCPDLPAPPTSSPVAGATTLAPVVTLSCPNEIWINEFHYQNIGFDLTEFVEIAHTEGMNLAGYRILFYDGSGGTQYKETDLGNPPLGTISESVNGVTVSGITVFERTNPLRDGPDGIAVVDGSNNVLDFISYGGSFTATNGPAQGLTATDVGVTEPANTLPNYSLQLGGTGYKVDDFGWQNAQTSNPGRVNTGQTFSVCTPLVTALTQEQEKEPTEEAEVDMMTVYYVMAVNLLYNIGLIDQELFGV